MDTKSTPSMPLKNQKHEKFAQLIADGKSETDAYTEAYNPKSRNGISANASRLLRNDLVRARVRELQAENAKVAALSREESMQILAEIARGGDGISMQDRIRAIQENNRMNGWSVDNLSVKNEAITFNLGGLLGGDRCKTK